jgi:hypothetical protein
MRPSARSDLCDSPIALAHTIFAPAPGRKATFDEAASFLAPVWHR